MIPARSDARPYDRRALIGRRRGTAARFQAPGEVEARSRSCRASWSASRDTLAKPQERDRRSEWFEVAMEPGKVCCCLPSASVQVSNHKRDRVVGLPEERIV